MSKILIRKFCQPILDKAGYSMFHAEPNQDHWKPQLVLSTACGKEIAHVHGVTFPKYKITITEAQYSAVLLEDWLIRNKKDFGDYVDAYMEAHSAEYPSYKSKDGNLKLDIDADGITVTRYYDVPTDVSSTENKYRFRFQLASDNLHQHKSIEWDKFISLSLSSIKLKLKLGDKVYKQIEELQDEYEAYLEIQKTFEDVKAKIETCSI